MMANLDVIALTRELLSFKGLGKARAVTQGKTAHSSMPELGDNAIYKAAKCITGIEAFRFGVERDMLLGYPTINVVLETVVDLNPVSTRESDPFVQLVYDICKTEKYTWTGQTRDGPPDR